MSAKIVSQGLVLRHFWGCKKCQQFYYHSELQKEIGLCPGGGRHKQGTEELKVVDYGKGESDYRICKQCATVHQTGSNTAGMCAGGAHHPHDLPVRVEKATPDRNGSYLFPMCRCKKCACLFQTSTGSGGLCAKGGAHEGASGVFKCEPYNK